MSADLVALRKLAMAATPGPWMHLFGDRFVYDRMEDGCRGMGIVCSDLGAKSGIENRDFIAAANPATILALLDELEAAKRERDALRCCVEQAIATQGATQGADPK